MLIMFKKPGRAPEEMNIRERSLARIIKSLIGEKYTSLPFGNGIVILMPDSTEPNFQYVLDGEAMEVFGPAIIAGEDKDGKLTGLDRNQQKIVMGCFQHIYVLLDSQRCSSVDVWSEIEEFVASYRESRGGEILRRKNTIIARSVTEDDKQPLNIDEYISLFSARPSYVYDAEDYVDRHAAKGPPADFEGSPEDSDIDDAVATAAKEADVSSITDGDGEGESGEGPSNDTAPIATDADVASAGNDISDDAADEEIPYEKAEPEDECERWYVANLLESADETMPERSKQQIVAVLLDKFRLLLSLNEGFYDQTKAFIEGDKSPEEKDEFFKFITSTLIKHTGVKEEYARRHPEEFRSEEDADDDEC